MINHMIRSKESMVHEIIYLERAIQIVNQALPISDYPKDMGAHQHIGSQGRHLVNQTIGRTERYLLLAW